MKYCLKRRQKPAKHSSGISKEAPIAADAFRVELFDAIDGLSETAKDWSADQDSFRHYHLKHFPYTVMYEVRGWNVTIFAIAHQRKQPGYWKDR